MKQLIKLDIGCGLHPMQPIEEWKHLDGIKNQFTDIVCEFSEIPLKDKSVSNIHIGDVIEHILPWNWEKTLTEWNRIMVIGGEIDGATPNIDRVMKSYGRGEMDLKTAMQNLYGWQTTPYETHYTTFTKETLTDLFAKYGFEVTDYSCSPGDPNEPWWLVFKGTKIKDV